MLVQTLPKNTDHGIVQTLCASNSFIQICLLAGLLYRSYRKKKKFLSTDLALRLVRHHDDTSIKLCYIVPFPAPVQSLFCAQIYDEEQTKLLATWKVLRGNRISISNFAAFMYRFHMWKFQTSTMRVCTLQTLLFKYRLLLTHWSAAQTKFGQVADF